MNEWASFEDKMRTQWRTLEDAPQAVALSTEVLEDVIDGRLDPTVYRSLLAAAIDPQVDGPGGRCILVYDALRVAQPAYRLAEESAAHDAGIPMPAARIRLRADYSYNMARVLHLLSDTERRALEEAYALIFFLQELAERELAQRADRDDEAPANDEEFDPYGPLKTLMRSSPAHIVVEHAVAAVSIFMAIIKKNASKLRPDTMERFIDIARGLASAYILDEDGKLKRNVVLYKKTDALAAQGFYLFRRYGAPEDAALVKALYDLDCRVRPHDERSLATVCLREMEWARFVGDLAAAEQHENGALAKLAAIGGRHVTVVQIYGWVRPPRPRPAQ